MSAIQQLMASFKKPPYTEYAFFNSFGAVTGTSLGSYSGTTLDPSGSPSTSIGMLNLGKSSGKWYWEITLGNSAGSTFIGIAKSTFPMNTYPGYVANSIAWSSDSPTLYTEGVGSSYGAIPANYAVIGVALDMDAGTLTFYSNNVSQGTAATGLTGTWYGIALAGSSVPPGSITLNSGPTTVYSPPAGHSLMSTYYP